MPDGDISAGGGGIDLSRLISAISPILLGTGKTSAGNNTSSTSGQSSDQTSTTQKNADPGTLAALLGIAQNASDKAQNPDITNQIVQNIFQQSATAFAPTAGAAASTGLYNTSTLGLLSDNARAQATAQAASAVLNFQTSQQQIAQNSLTSVLGATGSSTTTSKAATQTANAGSGTSFNITAPSLSGGSLLSGIGGIAASVLGKKALDATSPFLQAHLVDPIKNALGFGDSSSSYSDTMAAANTVNPGFAADASGPLTSGVATGTVNDLTGTASSADLGLDISAAPGAVFSDAGNVANIAGSAASDGLSAADLASANGIAAGTSASDITIAGTGDLAGNASQVIPGSADALTAPTVDIAAAAGPDTGNAVAGITPDLATAGVEAGQEGTVAGVGNSLSLGDATAGGLEGSASGVGTGVTDALTGGSGLVGDLQGFFDGAGNFISDAASSAGNFIGDAFANAGDTIAGGLGSLGLNQALQGVFGNEVGTDLGDAASVGSFISGEAGGPTIGSLVGEGLGAASSALGLTAVASGAGLEAAGGFATFAGLEGAADVAGAGLGAAAAVGGADVAAAGAAGLGFADVLPIVAAVVGWIICTELKVQGKMSATLYRYGLKKFDSYPEWGKYGYLLWATPVVKHMRNYPNGLVTAIMCWMFNLRINNIAAKEGCRIARWTYRGVIVSFAVELFSAILGLVLLAIKYVRVKRVWGI